MNKNKEISADFYYTYFKTRFSLFTKQLLNSVSYKKFLIDNHTIKMKTWGLSFS